MWYLWLLILFVLADGVADDKEVEVECKEMPWNRSSRAEHFQHELKEEVESGWLSLFLSRTPLHPAECVARRAATNFRIVCTRRPLIRDKYKNNSTHFTWLSATSECFCCYSGPSAIRRDINPNIVERNHIYCVFCHKARTKTDWCCRVFLLLYFFRRLVCVTLPVNLIHFVFFFLA